MLGSSAEKIKILGPRIPKVIILTTTTERQTNDYIEGIADERRHRLERSEVERANNSGLPPVLFARAVASPWQLVGWRKVFEDNGYVTLAPGRPMTRGRGGRAYPNPGIVAKFARDLLPGCQLSQLLGGRPACRASAGSGLPRRCVGHPFGVFVGQLEEQRVLVREWWKIAPRDSPMVCSSLRTVALS